MDSIFQHSSYVDYLKHHFPTRGPERGKRARLAQALKCQTSFLSQVFTQRTHLSLEHALKTSDFLKLTESEREYFVLLLQWERAGTSELKNYFRQKLEALKKSQESVKAQVQVKDVPKPYEQYVYYSSWVYAACHILCALPSLSTKKKLREHLGLKEDVFENTLRFLSDAGFIEVKAENLAIKRTRVHVDHRAAMVGRHHINWRLKVMEELEQANPDNLHFSALVGIGKEDGEKIRSILLRAIKESEDVVTKAREEVAYVMLMDFWKF